MLIAIDGPAGAGKSTVARALARELGYAYLDTGAMYRCVALLSLDAPDIRPAVLARAARIELGPARTQKLDPLGPLGPLGPAPTQVGLGPPAPAGARDEDAEPSTRVLLDGRDVSDAIRVPAVSDAASRVAADPGVREALVSKQRELIAHGDWVAEGRDIATVVAPHAELKVFLTADPKERARRRADELGADSETVLAEQTRRDERDSTLGRSTLQPAPGAVTLDTTGLTVKQVVARIVGILPQCPRSPSSDTQTSASLR